MVKNNNHILVEVAQYYSTKIAEHGETPRGVDWNSVESQLLRFSQLYKIIQTTNHFSLNDLGCGYGALFDYLISNNSDVTYYGYDVSNNMIEAAIARYANYTNANFSVKSEPSNIANYSVASGIFNVRLKYSDAEWTEYLINTLDVLNEKSQQGFAFNCLTSYSDTDKMRDYLYYADPCWLFNLCKRRYSHHVALLHDYGLYEFTLLIKKQL